MTLEELRIVITAQTSGMQQELNRVRSQLGQLNATTQSTTDKINSAFTSVKRTLLTLGIGKVIKDSIMASSNLEGAMLGLKSIVEGQGRSFSTANTFIQSYIKDGLVPLTDAVTTYKNLASRGYTDDQIQNVMSRLKDSASFGRQASLTLGEAVKTASEGLKNENSILVDNAGVTKNVAKMWEEYAKKVGKNTNELTQQEKIQAEVNGIMQETRFQVGDAAKYSHTFAGRLASLNKTLYDVKVNLGQAFMPIANTVLPLLQYLANGLVTVTSYVAQFMQALFGVNSSQTGMGSTAQAAAIAQGNLAGSLDNTANAAKKAKGALAGFDEINTLSNGAGNGTSGGSSSGAGSSGGGSSPITPTPNTSPITAKIKELADSVKGTLSELFSPLRTAWDKYGPSVMNQINIAKQNTIATFNNIKTTLIDIWNNGGKKVVDILAGIVLDLVTIGLRIYNEFILPIVNWFAQELDPKSNSAMANVLGGVDNLLTGVKKLTDYLAGDGFKYVKDFLALFTGFKAGVFLFQMGLSTLAIIDNVKAWIANNVAMGINIAMRIKDFAIAVANMVKGLIESIITLGKEAFTMNGATFAQYALNLAMSLNPIGIIIALIVALVASIIYLWNTNEGFRNALINAFNTIKDAAINIFSNVKNFILSNFSSTVDSIKGYIDGIKRSFNGIVEFVSGVFTGNWRKAWQGVKDIFGGMFDSLIGLIKAPMNFIIDSINSVFSGIGKIKIPDWVPGIGGRGFSIPKIPRLARGGIVDSSTIFMAGEAGKEAVMPLEHNTGWINNLASQIALLMGGHKENSSNSNDRPLEIILQVGSTEFGRIVINSINQLQRQSGTTLIKV